MTAVAILAGLGALDLVAVASFLGSVGAAEAQRKVLQWIAETAGQLFDWDQSVLNPSNWTAADDVAVAEAAENVWYESSTPWAVDNVQHRSSTVGEATLRDWENQAFDKLAQTLQDMGAHEAITPDVMARTVPEAKDELKDLNDRISGLPRQGPGSGGGPGLPPEIYQAALRLAAAGSAIVGRVLDQWGRMSDGFRTRLGAVCNKLFEASRRLADVAGKPIVEDGQVVGHTLENHPGLMVERFRAAVGEFSKAIAEAERVVRDFSLLAPKADSAVAFVSRTPETIIERLMLSGGASKTAVDQIMYEWLRWELAAAPTVLREAEQLFAAVSNAANATRGWLP